jgi:DNA-binding MarR family transcriptional regulator
LSSGRPYATPQPPPLRTDFLVNHMRAKVEAIQVFVQRRLSELGYFVPTPAHLNLMAHVPIEGIRPSQLAAQMQVTKQAVDQLLDQLEAGGAITRDVEPADRRAKLVRPTAWATEAYLYVGSLLAEMEERWQTLLGEDLFAHLQAALEILRRDDQP